MTDGAYDVGYKKPPESGKFQKGDKGPRKGRRKGSKNIDTLLREMLDSRVRTTINGREKQIPVREALVLRIKKEILSGPTSWMDKGLEMARRLSSAEIAEKWQRQQVEGLKNLTDEELTTLEELYEKMMGDCLNEDDLCVGPFSGDQAD